MCSTPRPASKAFDAEALGPAIRQMASFNETFDVELLIHLAQRYGPRALAVEPIVFTEDFAATNFPSVKPGPRHLAMVHQVVELYDRLVAPVTPVAGEAADLLTLIRTLDLDDYVTLIEHLRAEDAGDPTCSTGDGPCSTFAASSAADTRSAHPQRTHPARSRLRERASSRQKRGAVQVHVWLGAGDAANRLRRLVPQRVGQRVQQEVAGPEVVCGGPDELARDEFEGGP